MDEFKTVFKYFRKKNPKPNLCNVIDFDKNISSSIFEKLSMPDCTCNKTCKQCNELGLHCHVNWKAYTFVNKTGFIFIKNPFTVSGQQTWIRNALETYTKKPSITNLDAHYTGLNDVWGLQWSEDRKQRQYLANLRWATFGYHHDWDTKEYSLDNACEFPPSIKSLSEHVAFCVGHNSYIPEAAIVNFYHMGSSLGGHVDCSESDFSSPIISFSFGQSAVFLLGGKTKTDKPHAILIRSGDIILMGGECRLSYHAVPLIIRENSLGRFEEYSDISSSEWKPFSEYMKASRININIRQVFPAATNKKALLVDTIS